MKKWFVYGKKADFQELGEKLSLDPVLVRILRNRDLTTEEEMRNFLEGEEIPSPLFLPDSIRFLNRLERAMKEGEKVRIVGDYDVDGVCSTFVLYDFFRSMGADISYVIPHRVQDGYGWGLCLYHIGEGTFLIFLQRTAFRGDSTQNFGWLRD